MVLLRYKILRIQYTYIHTYEVRVAHMGLETPPHKTAPTANENKWRKQMLIFFPQRHLPGRNC